MNNGIQVTRSQWQAAGTGNLTQKFSYRTAREHSMEKKEGQIPAHTRIVSSVLRQESPEP
ncbi:hypothetical protein OOT00_04010 [Desulfobotulus sp. H1]|uniref:Uncharacterized protein n=1 Tax=Desulfobotulus pelophilus TaxID=2823377 RepID=A0ABT3N6R5_9BACT|nr:hypothetical protein [Desulfobotulus pelophilus]MCW7753147.1 hypothetical protein [Desulfobotulus pelophilus]